VCRSALGYKLIRNAYSIQVKIMILTNRLSDTTQTQYFLHKSKQMYVRIRTMRYPQSYLEHNGLVGDHLEIGAHGVGAGGNNGCQLHKRVRRLRGAKCVC